ncbi:hypothetical protein BHM03_00039369 [Ensete ventricosum]|nr:hypothetical protein BHM03_00039369 [Ensete ventricosum]
MHSLRFPNRGIKAKGRPPAEAVARKGQPTAGMAGCGQPARASQQQPAHGQPTASRGGGAGRRVVAGHKGQLSPAQGQWRWRRSEGGGLGHFFEKKMVMPLRFEKF